MNRVLTNAARFKNREFEFRSAHQKQAEVSTCKPHVLIFWAEKSYGSTAFLHELRRVSRSFHAAYFDCRESSVDGFLRDFILSLRDTDIKLHSNVLKSLEGINKANRIKRIFEALIPYIPYFGNIFLKLTAPSKSGIGNAYKVNFSPNQILAEISKHLFGKGITLLLDNLECLNDLQFKFLSELVFYMNRSKINFITCQNGGTPIKSQLVRLRELGCEVQTQEFKALNPEVMVAVASERNVLTNVEEWERFGDSDIYSCLEYIYSKTEGVKEMEVFEGFDPLSIYLIKLLAAVDQPLKEELVIDSALNSKQVVAPTRNVIKGAIDSLINEELILIFTKNSEHFLRIQPFIRGQVMSRILTVDLISLGSELYESCNKMIQNTPIDTNITDHLMAYFLSIRVDPNSSSQLAKNVLKIGMMGGENPGFFSLIKSVVDPKCDFATYLFCLIAGMNIKDHDYVLRVINEASSTFKTSPESLLLEGITLNRLRKYKESESRLYLVKNDQYNVVVNSYRLINLFHSGNFKKARSYFLDNVDKHRTSKFKLYFQRIGAGLLPLGEGIQILRRLLTKKELKSDRFGYYTTMSNLGALLHKLGDVEQGRKILEKSYNFLLPYGPDHITHCALSLSAARCVEGDYSGCIEVTKRVIAQPEDSHYSVAAKLNEAAALLLLGKSSDSIGLYNSIFQPVLTTPTWNVKSRYFMNFALAKCVIGDFDRQLDEILHQAKVFKHNNASEKWHRSYETILHAKSKSQKINLDKFKYNLLWGYFEYWWFTPMSILSDDSIHRI
jgi:tetratricopeptide (TPR) repeat protein